MKYYSALKRKRILTSTMWISLENIMLNEISKSQNYKYCTINSYEISRAVKLTETEHTRVVRGSGWVGSGELLNRVSVLKDKKVLEIDYTTLCICLTLNYKMVKMINLFYVHFTAIKKMNKLKTYYILYDLTQLISPSLVLTTSGTLPWTLYATYH